MNGDGDQEEENGIRFQSEGRNSGLRFEAEEREKEERKKEK